MTDNKKFMHQIFIHKLMVSDIWPKCMFDSSGGGKRLENKIKKTIAKKEMKKS